MGILESHFKSLLLIFGFFTALLLRVDIGGVSVAHSAPAGLVFAVCLTALSVAAGTKTKFDRKNIITGLLGGLLLIIPAAFSYKSGAQPYGSYLFWAAVVGFVALAEEAFLRGALFDVVKKRHNEKTAIAVAAVLFAALHIPLYGWRVVPLDLAVGIFLGSLRSISGSWIAPGIAHTLADLAGWWLR
jgi:membrane protease YdiL (CAAX protease family)